MRVYEFAKNHGVSSKEIIDKLVHEGFDVKSHMSVLGSQEIAFLEKSFPFDKENNKKNNEKKDTSLHNSEKMVVGEFVNESIRNKAKRPGKEDNLKKSEEIDTSKTYDTKSTSFQTMPVFDEPLKSEPESFIVSSMTVGELAEKLRKPVNEVIVFYLKSGFVATKNQTINEAMVSKLVEHYGLIPIFPEKKGGADVNESVVKRENIAIAEGDGAVTRMPIVVVIGHVDHGKTTLLDFIRKAHVAAKEKGGITQHIGAYEASTSQGKLVFIDTPGHEAFGKMRQRGIKVADVAILVVAADDGVMPQTVEAIRQAKLGQLPLVVAINKIDKADTKAVDRIKQQLSQYGVLVEEWGGDVICVPISAKLGTGVEELIDMIVLQSQMMDLRARVDVPARGYILEAKFEKGRGGVATVIAHTGSLHVGDYFACGDTVGRIISLFDSYGKNVQSAGPSVPVRISGFESLPEVGDLFTVVSKEEYRRKRMQGRKGVDQEVAPKRTIVENAIKIIIKADTNSSIEAIKDAVEALSKKGSTPISIVLAGVGSVNESDIDQAAHTGAEIIGFHVKNDARVVALAQGRVKIQAFDIIYRLLEYLQDRVKQEEVVVPEFKRTGEATILKVFDIKGVGIIAGAQVKDGILVRKGKVVISRNNKKVGEGIIESLQREKKTMKEVSTGFECAFMVEGFTDWQVGDRVECFVEQVN